MSDTKVIALGCRLNAFEAEVMRARAAAAEDGRPTVIINTCAVTAEATRQAGQTIRKARRENPGARLVVTGCAAQLEPERYAAMAEVDHVLGNAAKLEPGVFGRLLGADAPKVLVGDIMRVRETAGHLIEGFGTRARAYVEIQTGCDHRCTFCIIPFARGPSRSVKAEEIVEQIRRLAAQGFGEVVLTGVDITSYGADLEGRPALGALVAKILRDVPGLKRLRLSSIDGAEADEALIEAIGSEPRLMPHVHLSLQSGSNLILKRMKRRHLRDQAIALSRRLKKARPEIELGADLIAGFPTESDRDFQDTVDLVEEAGLTFLHVFPYSARPGTPAARMPRVGAETIKARARELRRIGAERLRRALSAKVGRCEPILIEGAGRGRTGSFLEATLPSAPEFVPGRIVEARVVGEDGTRLACEVAP